MNGILAHERHDTDLLYLARADVVRATRDLDVVGVVRDALRAHGRGETLLPDEAHLSWTTPHGYAGRSLAMPGGLYDGGAPVLGLKVINASLGNPARGLTRSQGVTMLFDPETGRPRVIMEAAYVSALRTAAVSAVAVAALARSDARSVALLGAGTLARAHLDALPPVLPGLASVTLYDVAPERAYCLAEQVGESGGDLDVRVASSPEECVRAGDVVIPVTTVSGEGYIPTHWFRPGATVVHVSLDDLRPEVVRDARLVVVDDWGLVSHDHRRLLGRMFRDGTLLGPRGERHPDAPDRADARRVDGTLADLVLDRVAVRTDEDAVAVCNPFGMSILDLAVADAVHTTALAQGAGRRLPT